jgi:hypothetical protein
MAALFLLVSSPLVYRVASSTAADSSSTAVGNVRFVKTANSSFDTYTGNPTAAQQAWMRSHYWRMVTYSPYFDSRLSWFPNAWTYKDLYAIYNPSTLATQHPEWILKDAQGNPLYIPFACSNGTCTQYAADFGNPDFRAYWINAAKAQLAPGYKGLYIDDVNMMWRVGNGAGQFVDPLDPRTGAAMTLSDWRRYMAEFTEQIKAALPNYEIVHNALWFAGDSDQYVQRELKSADWVGLERGINDSGITGGAGQYGVETFMNQIDWIHSQGRHVWFDGVVSNGSTSDLEYGLAGYFLTSDGQDAIGNTPSGGTPGDWFAGYDASLGDATGARYQWNGVWRRDFTGGVVLLNEPGASTKTLALGGSFRNTAGATVTSVTLGAGAGAILQSITAAPPSTPAPTTTTLAPTTTTLAPTTTTRATTTTITTTTTIAPTTTTTAPPAAGVAIGAPTAGADFKSRLTIEADPTNPGSVGWVDFLIDGTPIGTKSRAPYRINWTVPHALPSGPHTFVVVAHWNNGKTANASVMAIRR